MSATNGPPADPDPIPNSTLPDEDRPMRRTERPPLGESDEPGGLPTPDEWRLIKRERCRRKLAAHHTKLLAAAVFRAFGEASRPVLAGEGLRVEADGSVRSEGEDQVDEQFCDLVEAMHAAGGARPPLPCDVRLDRATGAACVVPHSHDRHSTTADGRDVRV